MVSEKSTFVADKPNQYVFRVADDATKPEIKAAVELMFKTKVRSCGDGVRCERQGQGKALRPHHRPPAQLEEGLRAPRRRPGNQLRGDGVTPCHLVKVKPTSPGRAPLVKVVTPELHKGEPVAGLRRAQDRSSGRNNYGHITMRHQGGGHKQHYRMIDFRRDKDGIPAKVERLEYDPNRSAHLALLLLRRRRAPLHDRAERRGRRRAAACPAPRRRSSPAIRCRCATFRSARRCTASRCCPARARSSRARPAARRRCWRAKVATRSCGCARARSARCTSTAAPPSARSATTSTTSNRSARPAACAGAACGRRCAAWR